MLLALCAIALATIVFSHTASASIYTNSRLNYGNAWNYCHTGNGDGPYYFAKGMVWISNQSDYYSEDVNIGTNANSVNVSIRGAVNACQTTWYPRTGTIEMYAIDVSTSYLSGMSSTSFFRGSVPVSGNYAWSSVGSKLYGNLDVSGVALCTAGSLSTGSVTDTIYISITRRQQQMNHGVVTYTSKDPGTEKVPIRVTRTCPTYNYSLTPTMTTPASNTPAPSGAGARTVKGRVTNNGPTRSAPDVAWRLTEMIYRNKSSVIPAAGDSTLSPCDQFKPVQGAAQYVCAAADTKSGTESGGYGYPSSNYKDYTKGTTIGNEEVGTRICYTLSVQQYDKSHVGDTTAWRHSTPKCYVISKVPKVQVWGGDLIVGRGLALPGSAVRTGVTQQETTGKVYGSWAEYAILPSGFIVGMASASGYAGGQVSGTSLCSVSLLSFVNATASGCSDAAVGRSTLSTGVAASIASRFPVDSTTPKLTKNGAGRVDIKNIASGVYTNASTDTTLILQSATNMIAGRWVVVNAQNATVVIEGNITYTPSQLSSPADIPQVIIMAKNIIIADTVTQVDAWLMATGTGANGRINTCGAGGVNEATLPNAGQCGAVLQVNGPVMANHLILRRTAGADSGTQAGNPGEIFNLRPDAYMWASNLQRGADKAKTVMTTEMPPRF